VSNLFVVMGVLKNDLNSNKEKEKKKRKGHRIIIFVYLVIQSCVLSLFSLINFYLLIKKKKNNMFCSKLHRFVLVLIQPNHLSHRTITNRIITSVTTQIMNL
jgi:hypothetical protein